KQSSVPKSQPLRAIPTNLWIGPLSVVRKTTYEDILKHTGLREDQLCFYHGTKKERSDMAKLIATGTYTVVLTAFETVRSASERGKCLFRHTWQRIIVDEAQNMKNI